MKTTRVLALAVALATVAPSPAVAQDHRPSGPVRIIVPFPPGGSLDVMARPLAEQLRKMWGQPVVVDNRAGASTMIGAAAAAKAPPDGLTLLFTADVTITSNPHLFAKMPLDPLQDLAPVTQLISSPMIVAVNTSLAVNSMQELVDAARKQPEQLNYASFGTGTPAHLLFEALRLQTGAAFTHVPYKGYGGALHATLAGEVQITMVGAMSTGFFESGKLRPLAIDSPQRLPQYPDLPTLAEAGFGQASPRAWFGLFVPRATPASVIEKIRNDVARVLQDRSFYASSVVGMGLIGVGSTPQEFARFIRSDYQYKGDLIRAAQIKAE